MENKIYELYELEGLSGGDTCIHRLHPTAKLLATVAFLAIVASFDKYSLGRLVPFVFYPTIVAAISETPYSALFKRLIIALPFCLFAGVTNVIFDRNPALMLGGFTISFGVVSLLTMLLKTYLCVMSVLIFVSVTPFSDITKAMRRLRVPIFFVTVFEITYRYVCVLFLEAHSMYTAYILRSPKGRGINIKDMGSFIGQLLLRSFDRAERVYNAMKCRGYALNSSSRADRKFSTSDFVFLATVLIFCAAFRFADVNTLLAELRGGIS